MLNKSVETIRSLVDERHDQKMTQQEISDITGIKPSNLTASKVEAEYPQLQIRDKREKDSCIFLAYRV